MSTPPDGSYITQILNAGFFVPATVPAPTMSQTEEIAELKRLNKALKAEKDATDKRASERYRDFLHADRRAERTEQALKNEKWERTDDQIKAVRLYNCFKDNIARLEADFAQAQQLEHSHVQLQELQTANTRLQGELAQHREAAARVQTSQSNALKKVQVKYEAEKQQFKEQSEKEFQKRLAEKEKQWKDESTRHSATAIQKWMKQYQSMQQEIERLQQQLKQSQQALDWHKGQLQQQYPQRVGFQGPQMAAGIHAGFPLTTLQSPQQDKDQARKRRRLNSTGDAHASMPEQGGGNTSTTTPKRKMPSLARQSSQNAVTPTRLSQHPATTASPLQSLQQAQSQTQALANWQVQEQDILLQAQQNGSYQLFHQFFARMNADRQKVGHPQLTIMQAWSAFNQQLLALRARQNPSQLIFQHDASMSQNMALGDRQATLQSPFLPMATLFDQQTHQSVNIQSPLSRRAGNFGTFQSMQLPQQCQQSPQSLPQNDWQSPATSIQNLSSMPTLTARYNANSPAIPSDKNFQPQAVTQQAYSGIDDMDLAAQLSLQLQDGNLYPSPEDSQGAQDKSGLGNQGEIPGWASPTPSHEHSSHQPNGQITSSAVNFQDFGNGLAHSGFSAAANTPASLPYQSHNTEASFDVWSQQHGASNVPQRTPQQLGLDPSLLQNDTNQAFNGNFGSFDTVQAPRNDQSASHQRHPSEAPSIISVRSSHAPHDMPATRPTISRKCPAAAPPAPPASPASPASVHSTPAPSSRSTPAPAGPVFPVCTHCHEMWWNQTCDAGESCQNCMGSGSQCERPKCLLEAGTCANARCPRVHEGDVRFRSVVKKPKTLKREGKKGERKRSPVEMSRPQ
ncbi:uncharacterized protein M421DRAFT_170002 [Didymella exigua CBS 183.55]|uniref:C3H1-type domain-containing protein n=1 Tax=Didymella exigua CBS 183.55 TaxID=1150837 RepID=A0A6A5RIV6_9PLEO|nr:uncharacterized protein M421DRAFT_170002 [Didymella exigua CBS 183.55]KAF1927549.1 hypothetical protein M421DRAFT_170002 [Didymella exigua CBS 183.55]